MPASSPADARSTEILTSIGQDFMVQMPDLTSGDFQIPSRVGNPLYDAVQRADIAELTQGVVDGTGAFDKVMSSVKAHLEDQFQKGRITGDQYVKAYIEMTGVQPRRPYVQEGSRVYGQYEERDLNTEQGTPQRFRITRELKEKQGKETNQLTGEGAS